MTCLKLFLVLIGSLWGTVSFLWGADRGDDVPPKIAFNRDVRPILSENCFACHGPDKNKRKGDLRLDMKDGGAFEAHEAKTPIVPGNPGSSELYRRVDASDPDVKMPPPKSEKKLTGRQVAILKKWIEQGAAYQPLWSFVAPERPEAPQVADRAWPRNAIDRFILARLEKEGFKPAAEAAKTTLIRRLTLDLLGLPPTPAEVDAYLNDASPDAYEKVVDRLLASPHFGERMAQEWLDAARYADTHGYHIDSGRDMTRWREWVIDAYNQNMPFDQFTVEQIAGDLLPSASLQQKIASGFNRNNMINFEGGAVPEEYETAYCIDRVNTTGTVWLGLTVACTQCHDHKFDPLTQKDFYRLFAFFHNVPENGLDGAKGNAAPLLSTPTVDQQRQLDAIASQIKTLQERLAAASTEVDAAQAEWEKQRGVSSAVHWTTLKPAELKSTGSATFSQADDGAIRVTGTNAARDTYSIIAPDDLTESDGDSSRSIAGSLPRRWRTGKIDQWQHRDDRLPNRGGDGRRFGGDASKTGDSLGRFQPERLHDLQRDRCGSTIRLGDFSRGRQTA